MPVSATHMSRLLVLIALCLCCTASHSNDLKASIASLIDLRHKTSELEPRDCTQLYGLKGERYVCGYLRVPESYTSIEGSSIKVPYLLIFPDKDIYDATLAPLLITGGGGPGNALLGNSYFPLVASSFWTYEEFSVADGRLLMILENRGVGHSQPNLDCHYSPEIYQQQFWTKLLETDLICGVEYASKNIELSQYNVHNAALDIEMFRRLNANQGLSTSQLNLYGISYGTRVAMYYERMFPNSTRTMILDSVSVNEPNGSAQELTYAQRSLDLVFSKCRADTLCNQTFGSDLESEFYEFMNAVGLRKISLQVLWPDRQLPISVPLTATLVIEILHSALYGSDTFATIPLTVRNMIDGSYSRLADALRDYFDTYSKKYPFYDAAFLTYLCFDMGDTSSSVSGVAGLKLFTYWELERGAEYMRRVCSDYGITAETDLLNLQFTSDTPTLFLSGELDPVTPPASALKAAAQYSYYWNITRQSASHDVISHSPCARFLASWFLYHPQEDLESRMEDCEPDSPIQFLLD